MDREPCAGPHVVEALLSEQSPPRSGGLRHRQRCCSPPSMLESSLAASCCPKDLTGWRPLGCPSRSASSTRSDVSMNASIPFMPSLQDKFCSVAFASAPTCGSSNFSQGLGHRVGPVAAAGALPPRINMCTSRVLQVLMTAVPQCWWQSAPGTGVRAKHRHMSQARQACSPLLQISARGCKHLRRTACERGDIKFLQNAPTQMRKGGSRMKAFQRITGFLDLNGTAVCMKSKVCAFAPQWALGQRLSTSNS